jgi:hypothetical protein
VAGSVVDGVVSGCVVVGSVVDGVVSGCVVVGCVVAGCVVAGGWVVDGGGDCGDDGGTTVVGVADWGTAPPFCDSWGEGEPGVLLAWVGGGVYETGEPPMILGTTMTAATSAASTPVASNTHASPRRFLRGGWAPVQDGPASVRGGWASVRGGWPPAGNGWASALVGRGSALVGWARKAAAAGVRCGCALVIVAGPLVPPAGGGA